jgi:hypothetical protein
VATFPAGRFLAAFGVGRSRPLWVRAIPVERITGEDLAEADVDEADFGLADFDVADFGVVDLPVEEEAVVALLGRAGPVAGFALVVAVTGSSRKLP